MFRYKFKITIVLIVSDLFSFDKSLYRGMTHRVVKTMPILNQSKIQTLTFCL